MAEIHLTTMVPSKLELLTRWLPEQAWYVGAGLPHRLAKVGGFRLDDPAGEVGIEFMFVTDESGEVPVTYHVPMSYRAAPLEGASSALVGTSLHGVLGERWIYDGARDPVVLAQLAAFINGDVVAQHQSKSDTPDPSVSRHCSQRIRSVSDDVVDAPGLTTIAVALDDHGGASVEAVLQIVRVLDENVANASPAGSGHVIAPWHRRDGTTASGYVVLVR